MKKTILLAALCLVSFSSKAQQPGEIIKTGWNIGPLPALAFDADKGFQVGAIMQFFNYGNGDNYPNYDSKVYAELSYFTKGSWLVQTMYDAKTLIPGVRWTSAAVISLDKGMDFYGFNGYQSYYDYQAIADGKAGDSFIYTPYYKISRNSVLIKSDFVGDITKHFKWKLGYHAAYYDIGAIDYDNINKNKSDAERFPAKGDPGYVGTLYEDFRSWGLISDDEAEGGFVSSIRMGVCYDTRDKEGAPSRGIWFDAHMTLAPKWLGTTNPFYRYAMTFRHYLPIIKNDVLTFAYRLNYEGTFGNNAPFYVLPYMTVQGDRWDRDGMGGYHNVRGLKRDRVVGLDMFTWNAELRWRYVGFRLGKQNIALAVNAFSDAAMVTRGRDMSYNGDNGSALIKYNEFMNNAPTADKLHITAGIGHRFIMNENFIVAAEYGIPISHLNKNSNFYNQDGNGSFYLNIGYLF